MLEEESRKYFESLKSGESTRCKALVKECVKKRFSVFEIYENVFTPALRQIGERWAEGELSITHEHRATQIVLDEMRRLRDQINRKQSTGKKVVACALSGDLHSLGARMVSDYFLKDGWDVEFLGADLPVEELIRFTQKEFPDAIMISATNIEALPQLEKLSLELNKLPKFPIALLGGKASAHAKKFENILYCSSALDALKRARELCQIEERKLSFEELLVSVGGEIQRRRKQRKLSQKQLAEKANIDRAYLSQVENGKKNLSLSALFRISRALGMTTVELLREEAEI